MRKRVLSLLLAGVLLMALCQTAAFADEEGVGHTLLAADRENLVTLAKHVAGIALIPAENRAAYNYSGDAAGVLDSEDLYILASYLENPPLVEIASGSFSSKNTKHIDIVVDWTIYELDGKKLLVLEPSIKSYSIDAGTRPDGLTLTVAGTSYSYTTEPIYYSGSNLVYNSLGIYEYEITSNSIAITASWGFHGTYSGVRYEYITVSGTAKY